MGDDVNPDPNPRQNPENPHSTILRAQRIVIGLMTLLLVDVIWVASSELTEYIFKSQKYSKPFFSTYLKTSLFMLYLPGFLVYKPWREQCQMGIQLRRLSRRSHDGTGPGGGYSVIQESDTDMVSDTGESEMETDHVSSSHAHVRHVPRSLSAPTFQPIRSTEGTDSEVDTSSKKVRFNRVAEVRSMSAKEAIHANLARLSYAASMRAHAALERAQNRLTVTETARLAITFSLLWFAGNYSYQAALADTEAAVVNVVSASSCLFTLILSAIFPSTPMDRLNLTKIVAVLFTISGLVLVCYSDLKLEDGIPMGSLWTLAGAFFYSSYIVFLRRKIDHEDKLDVPMFFGFVGLFSFMLLWPLFPILHFTNHERFELPNRPQIIAMLVNGIIGTVLSELLWLFGCFYTSSLIATLSISLTIPLTTAADVVKFKIKNETKSFDTLFYIGSVPMFLSFFLVAMVSHWNNWDPILECFQNSWKRAFACCFKNKDDRRRRIVESLENESLLNSEDGADFSSQTDAA